MNEEDKGFTISSAAKKLRLGTDRIKTLIKEGVLKKNILDRIDTDSVLKYCSELEERRKVPKPVWIYRNEF